MMKLSIWTLFTCPKKSTVQLEITILHGCEVRQNFVLWKFLLQNYDNKSMWRCFVENQIIQYEAINVAAFHYGSLSTFGHFTFSWKTSRGCVCQRSCFHCLNFVRNCMKSHQNIYRTQLVCVLPSQMPPYNFDVWLLHDLYYTSYYKR